MKKIYLLAFGLTLSGLTGSAMALEGSVDAGKHFTHAHVGLGSDSPGLAVSADWMNSDHDGNFVNLGANYGIGSDAWLLSPGAKVLFTNPKDSKDGYALALGSDLRLSLGGMIGLYGQYYWAPESLSAHNDGFQQAAAGVSIRPISLIDVRMGYKYVALNGKNGHKDNVLADGPYVGASLHF